MVAQWFWNVRRKEKMVLRILSQQVKIWGNRQSRRLLVLSQKGLRNNGVLSWLRGKVRGFLRIVEQC